MFMILLIGCALLGPEQSPPRANPVPNADLETYQSMRAKAGPRPRRTHPDGSLVRAARPECRKIAMT